jgi:hypothetical protein
MFCAINSSLLQWKEEKTFQLLSGACKAFAWRTCHGFMGGKKLCKNNRKNARTFVIPCELLLTPPCGRLSPQSPASHQLMMSFFGIQAENQQ